MSFDLAIRSDDKFSQLANVRELIDFIGQLPSIQWNGKRQFVLDDPPSRWMEIYLEFALPHGESDESSPEVNCVSLCIPYAFLNEGAVEQVYFPTAFAIAEFLGWQLHDKQRGINLVRS